MIRLNQCALVYLNEVIRHGSLRRAAQHLNIDPLVISWQLVSLEERLDVRLLQRTPQGAMPTEAGELLVVHYRQQRTNEEGVPSRLLALQGLHQGEVCSAADEGFIADLIFQPLRSFILRYSGIELGVRMAGTNEGMTLVKENAIDLAPVYAPVENGELNVHVDTHQLLDLIIPINYTLAGHRGAVPMRALRNESLALIHNSIGMGQLAVVAVQLEHIELRPKLHTNSVAVLTNFVKSGTDMTFMPGLTVGHEIGVGHIRCLPLAHPALRDTRAWIVSHKGRELTMAAIARLEYPCHDIRFFSGNVPGLSQR